MKASINELLQPLRRQVPLFSAFRAIFRPGPSVYRHLHFKGRFTVRISDNVSFDMNHFGYQIENELFWARFGYGYEGTALRVWAALAAESEFIADVGANTGVFALVAAAINRKAKVAALEPIPRIYQKALGNFRLNPFSIEALQIAASDTDGEVTLFDTAEEHSYSASIDATMLAGLETLSIPVRASRLDTLFSELQWPRIDLLKIDVEKHEPAVLAGMPERLAADRPVMLIEILNPEIGRAVERLLDGLGYRFFAISENHGLLETPRPTHADHRNFLFCPAHIWERRGTAIIKAAR